MKCPQCRANNPETARFCLDCGTKFDAPVQGQPDRASFTKTLETTTDELSRGVLFAGRYEVIEELGQGGMGRVYRVHDTKLNEEVALKLIRPEFGADKRTVERFHNEIKLARKIRHKNVCGTHDLHEEGRTLYLTMEYVRGEDLKSLIKRTKVLAVGTAVSIAHQVAEGLAEAHKLGIVHRDLKPGNIMIDKEGQAKIMDFGIARAMAEKGMTGAGAIIGTPEYMSPEQVEGKEADQRADIYALGVILFEMVTGQTPFEGETPLSIAHKHRYEPPPDPRSLNPQVPADVGGLILRCMEKPLEKRYQTTAELLADLEAVEATLPTTERAATRAPSRTRPKTSRDITVRFTMKRWLVPAAAVVVLAGAFLIWRFVLSPPVPLPVSAKPALAVLNFENISKNPELEQWRVGFPFFLRTQLGQSRFLKVCDEGTILGALEKLKLRQTEKLTADEYKAVAGESGATHLISGGYLEVGGKLIISLSLIDAITGAVIKPIQEEAPDRGSIPNSVDGLVKKIKTALNIEEPAVEEKIYKMVGDVYSRNPKALSECLKAQQLYENSDFLGGIAAMERAVAMDPGFAYAHMRLGGWYLNAGAPVKAYQATLRAYQLRAGLPERERILIELQWLTLQEKYFPRAHAIAQKLLERFPDDGMVRFRLAYTADDLEETNREYDNLIHIHNSKGNIAFSNLARTYCFLGEYRKARETWEETLPLFPPNADRQAMLARLFVLEGDLDKALKAYEKFDRDWPGFDNKAFLLWEVHLFIKEDPDKFRETFELLRKAEKAPADSEKWLLEYSLIKGKIKEALALFEKGWKAMTSDPELRDYFTAGVLYLQTGEPAVALKNFQAALEYIKRQEAKLPNDVIMWPLAEGKREALIWQVCALCDLARVDEAEELCRQIETLIPENIRTAKMKYGHVKFDRISEFAAGEVALSRKDAPAAIRNFEDSLRIMISQDFVGVPERYAYVLDRLGEAYELGGDFEKAARTFDRIPGLFTGRQEWSVVYVRSYYKAGKALEQMGKRAEAREKYTKFLSLWKDADPGLPEVEDAKKRLAAL